MSSTNLQHEVVAVPSSSRPICTLRDAFIAANEQLPLLSPQDLKAPNKIEPHYLSDDERYGLSRHLLTLASSSLELSQALFYADPQSRDAHRPFLDSISTVRMYLNDAMKHAPVLQGDVQRPSVTSYHIVNIPKLLLPGNPALPEEEVDPEYAKVREWRHRLQKAFLYKVSLREEAASEMNVLFNVIECYEHITVASLSYSKIGKVMRHISVLSPEKVPMNDEYHFRERAKALVDKWFRMLQTQAAIGDFKTSAGPSAEATVEETSNGKQVTVATTTASELEPGPIGTVGVDLENGLENLTISETT